MGEQTFYKWGDLLVLITDFYGHNCSTVIVLWMGEQIISWSYNNWSYNQLKIHDSMEFYT